MPSGEISGPRDERMKRFFFCLGHCCRVWEGSEWRGLFGDWMEMEGCSALQCGLHGCLQGNAAAQLLSAYIWASAYTFSVT